MKMGIEMSLETKLEQKLELKAEIQLQLEQKMALRLALNQGLQLLFRGMPDAPERMIDNVIHRAIAALPIATRDTIQNLLHQFPGIEVAIADSASLLAIPEKSKLEKFGVEYFFKSQNGIFFKEHENATLALLERPSLDDVMTAVRNPAKTQHELEFYRKQKDAKEHEDETGLESTICRLERATLIAEALRSPVKQLGTFVAYILQLHDPQTSELVLGCIREWAVLERFMPIASERIEHRLVTSIKKIGARDAPSRFEHATLNSVGETLLVGMGILAPELFELQGRSSNALTDTEQDLERQGIDVSAMKRIFSERKDKGVFWHRWKTTTVKPGALTDLAVREFITEHVRRDRKIILDSIEYPEFFIQAQELTSQWRAEKNVLERETISIEIGSHAMEMLGSEKLHECLKKLASGSWYQDLDKFFQK